MADDAKMNARETRKLASDNAIVKCLLLLACSVLDRVVLKLFGAIYSFSEFRKLMSWPFPCPKLRGTEGCMQFSHWLYD